MRWLKMKNEIEMGDGMVEDEMENEIG